MMELMVLQVTPWKLHMELVEFHELKILEFELASEDFRVMRISRSSDLTWVRSVKNERKRRRRERTRWVNMLEGAV